MLQLRLFIVFTTVLLASGCARQDVELELIEPGQPLDREIARNIVASFDQDSGLKIRLVKKPDDLSPLEALEAGFGDIAFESNDQPFRTSIATILPLYPTVLHIVVREERISDDITAMLDGARVFAGPRGSASRQLHEKFVAGLSLPPESQTYLDSPRGTDPDILIIYTAVSPERIANLPGYRLISFGTPDEIGKGSSLDRMTLMNPRMLPFIIPIHTYGPATPEPIVTVAVDQLLVARSDLEPTVAYDLAREIQRLWPALSGEFPSVFRRFDTEIDDGLFAFPLHPGARFFLNRDEPTLIERYSGVAEVVATLMVALISGGFAAMNIYRIRRKNRIDEFYSSVIGLRSSLGQNVGVDEKESAISEIRALQDRAFDMLVHEKLAADESFRIFITLANDTIDEFSQSLAQTESKELADASS